MNKPTVTIIMATFNRAHLIEETLVSIQNQSYTNWECLIIDDGSTDNTEKILESYISNDVRFKYQKRNDNYKKGLPGCRNYGLDLSLGDFIIFVDDDDIVHPKLLEIGINILINELLAKFFNYQKQSFNNNFDLINIKSVNVFDVVWTPDNLIYKVIIQDFPIASCTVLWRKECFINIRFNECLQYAEEWECYTRILLQPAIKGLTTDTVLYYNRKHLKSNTGEYYNNHNNKRRDSKIQATKLIINQLADSNRLNYKFGIYFLSLSLFLSERTIFKHLMKFKNMFSFIEFLKLNMRYYGNGIINPLYKFKKRLVH